jgi:hypothetical protein
MRPTLRAYDPFRRAETLGSMWTLRKGQRTVVCLLTTHPLGWELSARVDGELLRSEVCKLESQVFDTSTAWQRDWEAKRWQR